MCDDPENPDYRFVYSNADLEYILETKSIRGIAMSLHLKYFGRVCRDNNTALTKKLMFATPQREYYRDPWGKMTVKTGIDKDQLLRMTQNRQDFRELCCRLQQGPSHTR